MATTQISGIKSLFCYYCHRPPPLGGLDSWNLFTIDIDLLPPQVMATLKELVAYQSLHNSKAQLGFASDGLWLLKNAIVARLTR